MTFPSLFPGVVIDQRYALEAQVGSGAFGEVWRARDRRLNDRPVALKFLRIELGTNPQIVARFESEARALGLIQHPGIVSVIDRGSFGSSRYLVLEYVEGATLAAWLKAHRDVQRLPEITLVRLIHDQLCAAVAAAHALRSPGAVVHRDLKPANVMVSFAHTEVRVKILDFGIAQLGGRDHTHTGALLGTLAYMAPEQGLGQAASVGPAVDVFALCVLLYELLTLRATPASDHPLWSLVLQRPGDLPALLGTPRTEVPHGVYAELLRGLHPNPSYRHPDAGQLRASLQRAWDLPAHSSTPPCAPPVVTPPSWPDASVSVHPTAVMSLAPIAPTMLHAPPQRPAPVWTPFRAVVAVGSTVSLLVLSASCTLGMLDASSRQTSDAAPNAPSACGDDLRACMAEGERMLPAHGAAARPTRARELFQDACGRGALRGCVRLGELLRYGVPNLVARDDSAATAAFQRACDGGELTGCTALARQVRLGIGVTRDRARAIELLNRACTGGDLQGCNDLGDALIYARVEDREIPRALGLFQRACQGGNAEGCDSLGMLYRDATGVTRDHQEAVRLFQQACSMGLQEGCSDLAAAYFDGEGVVRDQGEAVRRLRAACDGGSPDACVTLGGLHKRGHVVELSRTRALALFERACAVDFAHGCNQAGILLEEGGEVARDYDRTAQLYQRACDLDFGHACYNLGDMHRNGRGVTLDLTRAATLFRSGCELGSGSACAAFGTALVDGRGVEQNAFDGVRYYRKGCELDDRDACYNLAMCADIGTGMARDPRLALRLYDHTCTEGYTAGCNRLGVMLYEGLGAPPDRARARAAFQRACAANVTAACTNLRRM